MSKVLVLVVCVADYSDVKGIKNLVGTKVDRANWRSITGTW